MDKKGSHVGVVISFVIFIVFLGFLYSIIEPIKTQKDKESVLNYLETALVEEFSANLTTASIKVSENVERECFGIAHITDVENLVIKNEDNGVVGFDLNLTHLRIIPADKKFFKIYYSEEEFNPPAFNYDGNCSLLSKNSGYSIGLVRKEKYVFATKMMEILEDESKYEELKEDLRIPRGSEFDFSFKYSGGELKIAEEKEISTNIYIKEVPIKYVDKEANINSGFIKVRVW